VKNLPLQVAEVDGVEIDDADRADTCCREIQRGRRSQAAGTDAQNPRRLEAALPFRPDLRKDQVRL